MPNSQKDMNRQIRWSGPCPTCGCKKMLRKTKDANSPVLGWVECTEDNCTYEADFETFRTAAIDYRRAHGTI